jgi:hypothetical protein
MLRPTPAISGTRPAICSAAACTMVSASAVVSP